MVKCFLHCFSKHAFSRSYCVQGNGKFRILCFLVGKTHNQSFLGVFESASTFLTSKLPLALLSQFSHKKRLDHLKKPLKISNNMFFPPIKNIKSLSFKISVALLVIFTVLGDLESREKFVAEMKSLGGNQRVIRC
jgi:hypothetical protein